ncbi:DDE superfamily endonuclease [Hirsutella rhossiliensis]
MIKNFAQDMAKMKVGKNWPYSFVNRHRNELGCTWFDGFDVARKRADSASKYRDYFELKLRSKIEEYDIAPCNTASISLLYDLGYRLDQPRAWKEWLVGVFDRFTKAKARNGRDYRLLITDGHSSHINTDFLEWCDQHRIIVAVFPPHSTHRLQPLDVSLFGPLSTAYTNQLIRWMAKTQGLVGLSKREFWTLILNALEASFSPENIANGWMRTGLLPLDSEVVLSQIVKKEYDDSDAGSDSEDSPSIAATYRSRITTACRQS